MSGQAAKNVVTDPPQISVVKSITVELGVREAFDFFTQQAVDWWPRRHQVVAGDREVIVFQPRRDGRWYERASDGAEADWGRVLLWNPPYRLAATWRIGGRWQLLPDDDGASEIEVVFIPDGADRTVIRLTHRGLERLGEHAGSMRAALDLPGPGDTLGCYAAALRQ